MEPIPIILPTPSPPADEPRAVVLALNRTDRAIATHLARRVIDTLSNTYDATNTHYAVGEQSKTRLLQRGMITASPILSRGGRGGRAVALQLTTNGYEWLKIKPPRGGAQHEYLLQRLHNLLSGSSIEVRLDGKAPDLVLRYDAVQHADFLLALNEHATTFDSDAVIPHNTMVAIEIECSNPSTTIPNNLIKDRAAGLKYLIFAVMPKDEKRVIKLLRNSNQSREGVMVIDALKLLDHLRKESTNG